MPVGENGFIEEVKLGVAPFTTPSVTGAARSKLIGVPPAGKGVADGTALRAVVLEAPDPKL
jgi:hypothetical protein